jgi:hypothetical protein
VIRAHADEAGPTHRLSPVVVTALAEAGLFATTLHIGAAAPQFPTAGRMLLGRPPLQSRILIQAVTGRVLRASIKAGLRRSLPPAKRRPKARTPGENSLLHRDWGLPLPGLALHAYS